MNKEVCKMIDDINLTRRIKVSDSICNAVLNEVSKLENKDYRKYSDKEVKKLLYLIEISLHANILFIGDNTSEFDEYLEVLHSLYEDACVKLIVNFFDIVIKKTKELDVVNDDIYKMRCTINEMINALEAYVLGRLDDNIIVHIENFIKDDEK